MYTTINTGNIAKIIQKENKTEEVLEEIIGNIGFEDKFYSVGQALVDTKTAKYATIHSNKLFGAGYLRLYSDKPEYEKDIGEFVLEQGGELLEHVFRIEESEAIAYARKEAIEGDPRMYMILALDKAKNKLDSITTNTVHEEIYLSLDQNNPVGIFYELD